MGVTEAPISPRRHLVIKSAAHLQQGTALITASLEHHLVSHGLSLGVDLLDHTFPSILMLNMPTVILHVSFDEEVAVLQRALITTLSIPC